MRRIDPMSVLFALALLGCAWLVHGCARDPLPVPGDFGMARDYRSHPWCAQEIGDGGGDQLAPGSKCDAFPVACAPAVSCSFESFDHLAACSDGVCCQWVSTRSMVDGHVIQFMDCGMGLSCVNGC